MGMDSATSENDRVMAPEPIGSHPIPEPDALFIDQVIGQVKSTGTLYSRDTYSDEVSQDLIAQVLRQPCVSCEQSKRFIL